MQGMVGHRHTGSLSRVDVSSGVVMALGVLHICAFLCATDAGEEQQGAAKCAEKLLLHFSLQ